MILIKTFTATTRTKIKVLWNSYKNRLIFTPNFALRVTSLIFPFMTAPISNDITFFYKTLEYVIITFNLNVIEIGLLDLEILTLYFQPEVDFLNQKWTLKHTQNISFWN